MKKKILWGFVFAILFLLVWMPNAKAAKELDEIQDYTITIDMKEDGTMDMKYHIEWKVLDSTTEGPLEWVKIGVANKHVSKVKKVSDNIKKIKYTYDYGNYVRIDFKKKHYIGEVITFEFTLNQAYMYNMNSDGTCTYTFTPGWFEDINVKKATIRWNKNNVQTYTKGAKEENGYFVWTKSLAKGQKMSVQTTYYQGAFKLDVNKQAKNAKKGSQGFNWESFYMVIVIIIVIAVIIGSINGGGGSYYRHSGFGYYPYYPHYHHHHHGGFGGGGSSCACVSCACACACAGGGRAGCSKKDFYGTNLRSKKVKKAVK